MFYQNRGSAVLLLKIFFLGCRHMMMVPLGSISIGTYEQKQAVTKRQSAFNSWLTQHHVLSTNTKARLARNFFFFWVGVSCRVKKKTKTTWEKKTSIIFRYIVLPRGQGRIFFLSISYSPNKIVWNTHISNICILQIMNGAKRRVLQNKKAKRNAHARTQTHACTHARTQQQRGF